VNVGDVDAPLANFNFGGGMALTNLNVGGNVPLANVNVGDSTAAGARELAANGLLQYNGCAWSFRDARHNRAGKSGLCGWRMHLDGGLLDDDPATRPGGSFLQTVLHGSRSSTTVERDELLEDSVLALDEMVNPSECAILIAATDLECKATEKNWVGYSMIRIQCHPTDGVNLSGHAHAVAHTIIARALWSIEHLRPELAAQIFPTCDGPRFPHLADMSIVFSWGEPYINRYTAGGVFEPHVDGHALTVLVPLSTPDVDFGGGGTAFWSEAVVSGDSIVAKSFPPSLVLRPAAGTGLFWRGHITHAGLPVTAGVRHVFVASFDLKAGARRAKGASRGWP